MTARPLLPLLVEYGLTHESFEWCSPPYHWNTIWEKSDWCEGTFKSKEWHLYMYERRFYFKRQKDLTAFLLRWS